MAVGYDDQKQWLIVRNSWSDAWGLTSHFTLPYQYSLEATLSDDFWSIRMVQTPTGKAAGGPSVECEKEH